MVGSGKRFPGKENPIKERRWLNENRVSDNIRIPNQKSDESSMLVSSVERLEFAFRKFHIVKDVIKERRVLSSSKNSISHQL